MTTEFDNTTSKVVVFGHVSLEGLDPSITDRLFLLTPSLESQQQDEENAKKQAEENSALYQELIRNEKPTGTTHVYAIDPEGLAVGSFQDQSVLNALAATAARSRDDVVAALLPPNAGAELSPAAQAVVSDVKEQYLQGVVTVESYEELNAALQALF